VKREKIIHKRNGRKVKEQEDKYKRINKRTRRRYPSLSHFSLRDLLLSAVNQRGNSHGPTLKDIRNVRGRSPKESKRRVIVILRDLPHEEIRTRNLLHIVLVSFSWHWY